MSTEPDPNDILKTRTICDYCKAVITDNLYTTGRKPYTDLHYDCYLKVKDNPSGLSSIETRMLKLLKVHGPARPSFLGAQLWGNNTTCLRPQSYARSAGSVLRRLYFKDMVMPRLDLIGHSYTVWILTDLGRAAIQ